MLQDRQRLIDRYDLIKKLGQGGMAAVYLAWDTRLERNVAIKVIDDRQLDGEEGIERFIREAKIVSSLNHPNIVQIHDIVHQDETHFIVMEYVDGPSLHQVLKENEHLSEDQVIGFASQICDGLAHAHENGIIHRDIKPHNILCTASGVVKIADFGISKLMDSTKMTLTGMVMGSVHYFSPEQASAQVVQPSSDVYSLGVVMYEMITGKVPFDEDSYIAIAMKHINQPVPSLKGLANKINPKLIQIIYKALEKNPVHRFQTASEMKLSLSGLMKQDIPKTSKEKDKVYFFRKWVYLPIMILLLGVICTYVWYGAYRSDATRQTQTTQTNEKSLDTSTSKAKGNHPWWKELPKNNKLSRIFHNRKVVGENGEYDVSVDVGDLPTSKFYYNIYVVDRINSRLVISKQIVKYKRSSQSTLTPVKFHVSVPEQLLPTDEGILKIELYWKNNLNSDEKNYVAEESLLQQWGTVPHS
ncbi:protein kinase [Shimazuella sp. AN120528]|uniref:protein kinase domain-containing protein n=1 Tax=Shimazuella soli TaxID=1892854 RepID=UPI001F105CF2|nr:protein kinase [Shimazuella soli]